MRLRELKLRNFRNYTALDLTPGEGLNLFVGENAQGKSNLLEAVFLLATSKSLRAGRESEMIQRTAEMAAVGAEVAREREGDVGLELSVFQTDKKSIRVNGVRRPRVIELLGQLNAVFFGAVDMGIVSGEPSLRRRYLNLEISQISPKYCFDLAAYKKALDQRNRLLRDLRERPYRNSGLDAWNEQLVRHGAPLIEKRRFFIERLAPLADEIHRDLTDGRESLEVRYLPSIPLSPARENTDQSPNAQRPTPSANPSWAAVADAFRAEVERVAADEMRRGVTLTGPQRDDLQFLINGADARTYGSQGQQRTVVLSLKLAEFRLMEEYVGEAPVMLLDDVMSDLDDARQKHLLGSLRRRCQTFLTCTSLRAFPPDILAEAHVYHVREGMVTKNGSYPQPEPEKGRPRRARKTEPMVVREDGPQGEG
jgi:DNA replication and repair protein RecF